MKKWTSINNDNELDKALERYQELKATKDSVLSDFYEFAHLGRLISDYHQSQDDFSDIESSPNEAFVEFYEIQTKRINQLTTYLSVSIAIGGSLLATLVAILVLK